MTSGSSLPALHARERLRAYAGVAYLVARTMLIYRSNFLANAFGPLLQVFLLRIVWTSVFPKFGYASINGHAIMLETQIAYSTLATVQFFLFSSWSMVPRRVREGTIAIDLARPVSFNGQMFAGQLGHTLGNVPSTLLTLPFAVLIGGAKPPASIGVGFMYVTSLVFAYLISVLLGALIGMVAFWTLEIQGIMMIYQMLAQFLAGVLVPLWFMPGWLRGITQWLPFQGTTYTPIAIYLSQIRSATGVLAAVGVQVAWVLALSAILWITWSRALRRITVQGG